jgi:tRNA(adenine34) deaminase
VCKELPRQVCSPLWPMNMAIRMAERAVQYGEVPVGAVLMWGQRVIARAHNRMNAMGSPLAHAEMLVLVQGMKKLSTKYLSDCQLYVTLQPCAFCTQGLILARIGRVYFGAYDTSLPIAQNFESIGGVQERMCQGILWDFFRGQRAIDADGQNVPFGGGMDAE